MLIAQISDLHVTLPGQLAYGIFDTAGNLSGCLAQIMQANPVPDVVLATGDLVETGAPDEYRRLRELLAPLTMPLYLIPGNHDDRAALCAAFRDHAYLPREGEPLRYAVEDFEVRLIALDTMIPGADGGTLDDAQLDWFDATLSAAPGRPTLVLMHHPPFKTGIRCMDEIALDAASACRLGAIVERHRHVERIVCGHVHRGIQARWRGTAVSVCPSTAFQYILDLRENGFNSSTREPPAYQAHFWNGAELVTHTIAVTR
ncbi:MAG: hypothetical protein A3F74_03460 [Betaproteobacteria bacterium RIFCSPLOWO2_12_FULL_62_58]|nr:MAG: hypothetical protein A3I62_02700 [Betaproteobacteria bacterium RIFCSPLOWO2_02_FULL_62_79]OGA50475.1 MAG: hypothetical protein A3F74_03460 [Betaproteobacteria bacterium RIFCSPLOWO2_12_FULL_62_58]